MSDQSVHLAKWMAALEQVTVKHLVECPHQLTTQILDFCERHSANCHRVALGQVVALTKGVNTWSNGSLDCSCCCEETNRNENATAFTYLLLPPHVQSFCHDGMTHTHIQTVQLESADRHTLRLTTLHCTRSKKIIMNRSPLCTMVHKRGWWCTMQFNGAQHRSHKPRHTDT